MGDDTHHILSTIEKEKRALDKKEKALARKEDTLRRLERAIENREEIAEELAEREELLKEKEKALVKLGEKEEEIREQIDKLEEKRRNFEREISDAKQLDKKEKELIKRETEFQQALNDLEKIKVIASDKAKELETHSKELSIKRKELKKDQERHDKILGEIKSLLIKKEALDNEVLVDKQHLEDLLSKKDKVLKGANIEFKQPSFWNKIFNKDQVLTPAKASVKEQRLLAKERALKDMILKQTSQLGKIKEKLTEEKAQFEKERSEFEKQIKQTNKREQVLTREENKRTRKEQIHHHNIRQLEKKAREKHASIEALHNSRANLLERLKQKQIELQEKEKVVFEQQSLLERNQRELQDQKSRIQTRETQLQQKEQSMKEKLESKQKEILEVLNTKEAELRLREGKLNEQAVALSEKHKKVHQGLHLMKRIQRTVSDVLPLHKESHSNAKREWSVSINELHALQEKIQNIERESKVKTEHLMSEIALAKAKEEQVKKLLSTIREDKKVLEEKENSIVGRIEDLQRQDKELSQREASLAKWDSELKDKEVKIARVKELNENISQLKEAQKKWTQLVNEKKNEYDSFVHEMDRKSTYLNDVEEKLSQRVEHFNKSKEVIMEEEKKLIDTGYVDPLAKEYFKADIQNKESPFLKEREHVTSAQEIHGLIQSTRDLITQGRISEAQKVISEAEQLSSKLAEDEKRRLIYGLMELKTEIRLAQL